MEDTSLLDALRERAKADPQRVAFAEADDDTMMDAVGAVAAEGVATCVLVGHADELRAKAASTRVCSNSSTSTTKPPTTTWSPASARFPPASIRKRPFAAV